MTPHQAIACYSPKLSVNCKRPQLEAPKLVSQYIDASTALATWYGCSNCHLLQELYLKRALSELLHHIADPLVHESIRQQCLEQLYKPLLSLKRYYRTVPNGLGKYIELEYEAKVISHEFNPFN